MRRAHAECARSERMRMISAPTAWARRFAPLPTLLIAAALASVAHAQDYPNRFIRAIVGPGPDIVARLFGPKVSEALGQQMVIEQRPGAGGVIAAQSVAAAAPDGYTLLQATASYTINTALQTSPLDLGRDFAPVGLLSTTPFVLVVHPSVPAKNLAELIAYAKANPGKLNYASSGIGTPPHLAGELFKSIAAVDRAVTDQRRHGARHRGHLEAGFAAGARAAGARRGGRGGVRSARLEWRRGAVWHAGADHRQAQRRVRRRARRRRAAPKARRRRLRAGEQEFAAGVRPLHRHGHGEVARPRGEDGHEGELTRGVRAFPLSGIQRKGSLAGAIRGSRSHSAHAWLPALPRC